MESSKINKLYLIEKLNLVDKEDNFPITPKKITKETIQKMSLLTICIFVILVNNKSFYTQEKFDSRKKAFEKAKYFLESNIRGLLLQNITNKSIDNPIVSAVIPVYNSKQYIPRAIKSVQNQNFTELEIILVNDYSTDDTLSIILEIQREDQRIKIINNKKNMGILYSRCIGVLASKSKYIFPLDNDDMFLDKDVFQTIVNIAEAGKFDIVEFKAVRTVNGDLDILKNRKYDAAYCNHPSGLILHQPQLGNFPIWPGSSLDTYEIESGHVWGKCFRTKIYKKAINKMGEERYTRRMIRHEDILMSYVLCNTARSYKFVGKYGLLNVYRKASASRGGADKEIEMDSYHIYLLDAAIDFVKDTVENKRILVNFAMYLLSSKSLIETLNNDTFKTIFFSSINKVLKMNRISDMLKNEIRKKGKKLKLSFN